MPNKFSTWQRFFVCGVIKADNASFSCQKKVLCHDEWLYISIECKTYEILIFSLLKIVKHIVVLWLYITKMFLKSAG